MMAPVNGTHGPSTRMVWVGGGHALGGSTVNMPTTTLSHQLPQAYEILPTPTLLPTAQFHPLLPLYQQDSKVSTAVMGSWRSLL